MLRRQQCQPIISAIEVGNYQSALKLCDGVLRNASQAPSHLMARTYKGLAFYHLQGTEEAWTEAQTVMSKASKSDLVDVALIGPLSFLLVSLGKKAEAADLLEEASKSGLAGVSTNEVLACRAFEAMIDLPDYLRAQQVAARAHKSLDRPKESKSVAKAANGSAASTSPKPSPLSCSSSRNRHFWWSIQSYFLLATETPKAQGAALALTLAERMVEKHIATEDGAFDEKSEEDLMLYANVLIEQARRAQGADDKGKKREQALTLLTTEPGSGIALRSLGLKQLKLDLLHQMEKWETLSAETGAHIEAGDLNWVTIEKWIQSQVSMSRSNPDAATKALETADKWAEKGATKRDLPLARLSLQHELRRAGSGSVNGKAYVELLGQYVDVFGRKLCCFDDIAPFVDGLDEAEAPTLLQSQAIAQRDLSGSAAPALTTENDVIRTVNAVKLRLRLTKPRKVADEVQALLSAFYTSLACSASQPKTLPRPATDLLLLAAQLVLDASSRSSKQSGLRVSTVTLLICLLNHAAVATPASYALKLVALRLYLLLESPQTARNVWKDMKIRAVQNESLGWLWSERYGSFDDDDAGDGPRQPPAGPYLEWRKKADRLYTQGSDEGPRLILQAFERGNYRTAVEFIKFGQCLDRSVQHQLVRTEAFKRCMTESSIPISERRKLAGQALKDTAEKVQDGLEEQWDRTVLYTGAPLHLKSLAQTTSKTGKVVTKSNAASFINWQAQHLAALAGIDVPEPLALSLDGEDAQHLLEEEVLFAQCLERIANPMQKKLGVSVKELLKFVESALAGSKQAGAGPTLPWREVRLVKLVLELYTVVCLRSKGLSGDDKPKAEDVSPALEEARQGLETALTSLATTLRQLPPPVGAIATPSAYSDDTEADELDQVLRSVLEAQKGGQGVREKVTKDVKEEVTKRRKRLAVKIEARIKLFVG